jgi:hypothetical protein
MNGWGEPPREPTKFQHLFLAARTLASRVYPDLLAAFGIVD